MNRNNNNKEVYVPPTVEVARVVLERNIAVHSPIQEVNLEDWSYDDPNDVSNNADIWLDI